MNRRINPFVSFRATFPLVTADGFRRWELRHETPEGQTPDAGTRGWFATYDRDGNMLHCCPLWRALAFIESWIEHEEGRNWLRRAVHEYAAWLAEFDRTADGGDAQVKDENGTVLASFGPRRAEGKDVEVCAHYEAEFFGIYAHDEDGRATWVADVLTAELAGELAFTVAEDVQNGEPLRLLRGWDDKRKADFIGTAYMGIGWSSAIHGNAEGKTVGDGSQSEMDYCAELEDAANYAEVLVTACGEHWQGCMAYEVNELAGADIGKLHLSNAFDHTEARRIVERHVADVLHRYTF